MMKKVMPKALAIMSLGELCEQFDKLQRDIIALLEDRDQYSGKIADGILSALYCEQNAVREELNVRRINKGEVTMTLQDRALKLNEDIENYIEEHNGVYTDEERGELMRMYDELDKVETHIEYRGGWGETAYL